MSDNICPICKYYGRIIAANHCGIIYQDYKEAKINLCYGHSVELFKNGQMKFMLQYRAVFSGYELLAPSNLTVSRMADLFNL